MRQRIWVWTLALLVAGLLVACGGGAPKVDWELEITGDVTSPLTLTYGELAGMEQVDLNDIMMEKSTGEDEVTSWSGVPVTVLFERAGVGTFTTITAVAADGYAIEVTADEMENAIVALKDSGEWIAEVSPDNGPIRLVTPQTPANRWVFQLTELQVNQ
jgi:DMSO/TMAO reductase YedYZ molybdopterin-dependent catalytic subunit